MQENEKLAKDAGCVDCVVDISEIARTPLEDWIDNYDVMEMLHISKRTLQTLRSNGKVRFSKIGRKIYYRRQDIQNMLAENYTMFEIHNEYGKKREKKTA
ncbi:MAG: helix-turn-helix domain-containing protein [Prevotella sp.]|nr:helix-turn-helix domain-containing protein [Prevotella sp.]